MAPDNLTVAQRSRAMSLVKRRDTGPELALRRALWAHGYRGYRVDDPRLPGRPDISWHPAKVAVFVDGKWWHGHPSVYVPGQHDPFWDAKIARNIARDRKVDAALGSLGWTVLRFWDFEVQRTLARILDRIDQTLRVNARVAARPALSDE
jgi:DNA mismatch endonuclease (patch repair protein)